MSVCRENQRFAAGQAARLAGSGGGGGAVPALRDPHGEELSSSPRFPSRVRFEKSSSDHDGDWISWRRENQRFAAGQGVRSVGNGGAVPAVPALGEFGRQKHVGIPMHRCRSSIRFLRAYVGINRLFVGGLGSLGGGGG